MKPRVFISSVMEGFEEYREAARRGITAAGGEAVLVEDYPGLSVSPRNVCLDGVASCDVYIAIVGSRGGWTAPSGKLVVEEEYDEARKRKLHVAAFVQNVQRDEDAQKLVTKISDYVDGVFRPTFTTSDELATIVKKTMMPIIQHCQNPEAERTMIDEKLESPHEIYNHTALRFVIVSERVDEFIDPIDLESPELSRQILEIGHSNNVQLFSYERPKDTTVEINEIVVHQTNEGGNREGIDEVKIEISTTGMITIDSNVTGRNSRDQYNMADTMVIVENDITERLEGNFAFVKSFFDARDPFKRYGRLLYNASLSGIGYRNLVSKLPTGNSFSVGLRDQGVVKAFDKPRLIVRADLENIQECIGHIITMFRRRMKS